MVEKPKLLRNSSESGISMAKSHSSYTFLSRHELIDVGSRVSALVRCPVAERDHQSLVGVSFESV